MSLRKFDDWDEAMEEARQNAIKRGEIKPFIEMQEPKDYDYSKSIAVSLREILPPEEAK